MNRKGTVYFIEGLPGSGKTTISNWLHGILPNAGLFTEDTPDYPNDFSAKAGMPSDIVTDLSSRFPFIHPFLFEHNAIKYVNIRHIESHYPEQIEWIRFLYTWEFGNEFNRSVSLSHYMACSLGLIEKWVSAIDSTKRTIIMDSAWLQNPINELFFRNAILHSSRRNRREGTFEGDHEEQDLPYRKQRLELCSRAGKARFFDLRVLFRGCRGNPCLIFYILSTVYWECSCRCVFRP